MRPCPARQWTATASAGRAGLVEEGKSVQHLRRRGRVEVVDRQVQAGDSVALERSQRERRLGQRQQRADAVAAQGGQIAVDIPVAPDPGAGAAGKDVVDHPVEPVHGQIRLRRDVGPEPGRDDVSGRVLYAADARWMTPGTHPFPDATTGHERGRRDMVKEKGKVRLVRDGNGRENFTGPSRRPSTFPMRPALR